MSSPEEDPDPKKRSLPKKRRGCGGILGCLFGGIVVVVLFFLLLALSLAWMGPGRHIFDGYEVVTLGESKVIISTPPEIPTCYIGQDIHYRAPTTETSVAIIGTDVTVSGDFQKDLSITAAKFRAGSATRIAGNLEVYAAEFYDDGIELQGSLSGSVMKNMHP